MTYIKKTIAKTRLNVNKSYEGEPLEIKVQRLVQNKEPLDGSVPLTYQERAEGVNPAYNIKTDKWEVAAEAMDRATKEKILRRADRIKAAKEAEKGTQAEGGEESA